MGKILVLGSDGQQGRIVSRYLLQRGYRVHGIDLYYFKKRTHKNWSFEINDVENLISVKPYNVVINCTTPSTNIKIATLCLEQKRHFIDLGSNCRDTEYLFSLSNDYKKNNITGITGCGSVPGIGNVMVRYVADQPKSIEMGFAWTSNIKEFVSPFSIADILYEYTGVAEYLENGIRKSVLPQDTGEVRHFTSIGKQRIFQVSHQESFTIPYYYKGLKDFRFYAGFPKHSDKVIKSLLELGITDGEIMVRGVRLKREHLLMLLLKSKPLPKGYKEKENLWCNVDGIKMECLVPPRKDWKEAGCNIDTGFPASIVAEFLVNGIITKRGFFSMEAPGLIPIKRFFERLKKEGMRFYQNGTPI